MSRKVDESSQNPRGGKAMAQGSVTLILAESAIEAVN